MNLRTTYFLFGAVVVVLVAAVLVLMFGSRGDSEDYLFPDLHPKAAKPEEIAETKKKASKLEIERFTPSGDALVFEKVGNNWAMTSPYHATIDSSLIQRAVDSLIDARLEKKTPTNNPSEAGLDPASAAINLTVGDQKYRALLGNLTLGSGGDVLAARASNPKKPIAFRRSVIEELFKADTETAASAGEALKSISEFRPRSLLAEGSPIAWQTVQKLTLKDGDKEIVLQKDGVAYWRFLKPDDYGMADPEGNPAGPVPDHIAGVKPLLTRLTGLQMPADKAEIIEGTTDFAKYGVDSNDAPMRIELTRDSGKIEKLFIGKKADDKGDKVYARLDDERCVVKLDAKSLAPIRKLIAAPSVMRDHTLTQIPAAAIDAIDIQIGADKPIELRRAGSPPQWRVFEGDNYENANSAAIRQLIDMITRRRNILDFPNSSAGDKALGLDPPAVEVSLWQDGILKDNKQKEKAGFFTWIFESMKIKNPSLKGEPTLRLKLGKKEKNFVYAHRQFGITSSLVTLPETVLSSASRPATDYLDLTLPSFNLATAVKLTFRRGPVKYEIEKEKGDPSAKDWKIRQPADMAGRTADAGKVAEILGSLQTAYANKIVAQADRRRAGEVWTQAAQDRSRGDNQGRGFAQGLRVGQ